MKKNFTKLVCTCMGMALGSFFLIAQNVTVIPQQDTEIRIGERKWPKEWPDSIIAYNLAGEKTSKTEYFDATDETVSYNYYSWESSVWTYISTNGQTKNEYDFDPYIYEFHNASQMTVRIPRLETSSYAVISYSIHVVSIVQYNDNGQLIYAEGNELSISIAYNERGQISSVLHKALDSFDSEYQSYDQYQYDNNGNLIEILTNGTIHAAAIYDSQERIVRVYQYYAMRQDLSNYSVYYYSDGTNTPTIAPENNTPVDDSNEGSFDLDINIPADSINNGSLVITLPEGFTLDEANTSLTIDFAGDFALKITKQDNNSWLLEITPKSTRSASLRADAAAKTLLNVAYKVNSRTERGTYDIVVNSILFESKGGNYYPEPAITIPTEVSRWGVSNELTGVASPKTYIAGNTLYIHATQTEQVSVYTLTGIKLYESTVSAGVTTIDAAAFPQGVLIVKGNGWGVKVVN